MLDFLRRSRSDSPSAREPILSFGSWDELSGQEAIQVCHPDWRGVWTVAYSFQSPVVESDDLERWGPELLARIGEAAIGLVVIQGWPPGSAAFARLLVSAGVTVKCLLHSSPAQHGAEPGEAGVIDEILELRREGVLAEVGLAKKGVHEAFRAAGHPVAYVPNRVPQLPQVERRDLGEGTHIGVFAEPFWRKNVTTQLLAVGQMRGAVSHVLARPSNRYLADLPVVEHGEMAWPEFVSLQGSMDLNLYVTLSECHPSTPQESYLAGVPCLVSRVSSVFESDPVLWDLTSVDRPDNPDAIAVAAERLLDNRDEAVARATEWMRSADAVAKQAWEHFTQL